MDIDGDGTGQDEAETQPGSRNQKGGGCMQMAILISGEKV